jgi:hypothetical protein
MRVSAVCIDPQASAQLALELGVRELGSGRSGNDDHIANGFELCTVKAEELAYPALDPIADDCAADAPARGNPDSGISVAAGPCDDDKRPARIPLTAPLKMQVFGSLANPA